LTPRAVRVAASGKAQLQSSLRAAGIPVAAEAMLHTTSLASLTAQSVLSDAVHPREQTPGRSWSDQQTNCTTPRRSELAST
jgi:hypothetical protein